MTNTIQLQRTAPNNHNTTRHNTKPTDTSPATITLPQYHQSPFKPKTIKKQQKQLSGINKMTIPPAAKTPTTDEIHAHLAEAYTTEIPHQTSSTSTDKALEGTAEWQNRPLNAVYPVVLTDTIHLTIQVLSTLS